MIFDRLHPALQHHIVNSLHWTDLRPVQELAIEATLAGANSIVLAPTAGGKTEAAFFPVISQTLSENWAPLSTLYVSPIRALLNNQEERLTRYYGLVGRSARLWHGDTTQGDRTRTLQALPDLLLTTPESLEGLLVSAKIEHRAVFRNLRAVVIDEIHAFANDDRGWHLRAVLERLSRIAGRDLQRIGLSATVGNVEFLAEWLGSGSERPSRVVRPEPSGARTPEVEVDYVGTLDNAARVISALHGGEKRLVFVDSRSRAEQLGSSLRALGSRAFVTHSSLGIDERRQAERAFAEGTDCIIVATSALELGIDIGNLHRVIQIDAPTTVSSFLQRMGRTGRRADTVSNCLFLATTDEGLLRAQGLLRLWESDYVEPVLPPAGPYHIVAQQLLALALQENGIGRSEWFQWVESTFSDLDRTEIDRVIEFMLEQRLLWDDQGILWLGVEGQSTWGRKNFLELMSVFTSPPHFLVRHGRQDIGQVHQMTFAAKQEGPTVLLLGGKSWQVTNFDWSRRIAHVKPTDSKGRTVWRGQGQWLSYELCQAIQQTLASDSDLSYLTPRAQEKTAELRGEYPWIDSKRAKLIAGESGMTWWTFAGGRANATIVPFLAARLMEPPKFDNFSIQFSASSDPDEVIAAVAELSQWRAEELHPVPDDEVLESLKFAECLPEDLAIDLISQRIADPVAVEATLARSV